MEDGFKSTDEKLINLQVHLNTIKDSIDPKKDEELGHLYGNLTNESDTCQKKADVKLQTLQSNVDTRIGILKNYINEKLETLGGRLEDKLTNNSLQLNDKLSQKLANYSTDSKTDIIDSLESLMQKSQKEQKTTLGNFSEDLDKNMNKTLRFLARIEINLKVCKKTDEIFDYKNQTRKVLDLLSSTNSTQSQHFEANSMSEDTTKRYLRRQLMRDNTLDRDMLCDTQTDGGGWIVIQRRTEGDVAFYRNWAEYKNGFGTPSGDFWLGNEAIYNLTNEDAYELRIDFNDGTQDLFAVYSSFRLESEADNYRLRLGSHSGTLEERSTNWGLSNHNGMQFSTYDNDNDHDHDDWYGRNCAETWHGAWWYRNCYTSNLNGLWGVISDRGMQWVTGYIRSYYARSTEMKMRIKRISNLCDQML